MSGKPSVHLGESVAGNESPARRQGARTPAGAEHQSPQIGFRALGNESPVRRRTSSGEMSPILGLRASNGNESPERHRSVHTLELGRRGAHTPSDAEHRSPQAGSRALGNESPVRKSIPSERMSPILGLRASNGNESPGRLCSAHTVELGRRGVHAPSDAEHRSPQVSARALGNESPILRRRTPSERTSPILGLRASKGNESPGRRGSKYTFELSGNVSPMRRCVRRKYHFLMMRVSFCETSVVRKYKIAH